jgi:hypothetical protein
MGRQRHVRFPPVGDQTADIVAGPVRANTGSDLLITSLARPGSGRR